jgi:hypothetical protein
MGEIIEQSLIYPRGNSFDGMIRELHSVLYNPDKNQLTQPAVVPSFSIGCM